MEVMMWAVGVGVVVALIVAFVVWYVKRANAKYAELWSALTGVVSGASKGAKLTGSYNGMPVQARINAVSGDSSTSYYYELTLTAAPQGKDWSLSYTGEKMLGLGAKSWHVKTKDEALKQRLTDGGILATIQQWQGHPDVVYKAKSGTLKYETKVGGAYSIPSPDEFKSQLELINRLAQVNQQANIA